MSKTGWQRSQGTPPTMQVLPLQQPTQESSSQIQAPETQRCPSSQAVLAPQRQAPVEEQLSVRIGSQAMQVTPSTPQVSRERVWQAPLRQHPSGQETEVQRQAPLTHSVPMEHGAEEPQRHSPSKQRSVVVSLHVVHTSPVSPQSLKVGGATQSVPLQQPLGQVVELQLAQAPLSQGLPAGQL
jgi:hypothetical protein